MYSLASLVLAVALQPFGLTTEYRTNPCGIDTPSPRLGWRLPAGMRAQTAYELEIDGQTVKCEGAENISVAWPLAAPASSQRVTWRVRVWDDKGAASDWSAPATFVMGKMDNWQAKWIGPAACTRPDETLHAAEWLTAPADKNGRLTLTRTFDWNGEGVVECVHAGVSQHEIVVNGKMFNLWSGHVHDWRYLRFRDMTPYLQKGSNTIVVTVFPDKPRGKYDPVDPIKKHAPSGVRAFIADITFMSDGHHLVTDGAWTSPSGAVKTLGTVRVPSWGRDMVLRAENASPAFERRVTLAQKPVRATWHVTGVGFYEAYINGKKVGKKVLDPSPTAYDKRVLYSTYPVEDMLQAGENTLKILVGHGWYDMRAMATWNFEIADWRDFPRAIGELEVVYPDGKKEILVTDRTWRQVASPIGYDDLFEGEVVGARDPTGPDLTASCVMAEEVPAPCRQLVAEAQPGAEVCQCLPAQRIWDCGNGTYTVDFGQTVSGWMRMTLKGQRKGDVVSVRYEERLNTDGTPVLESARNGLFDSNKSSPERDTRHIDVHFRYTASQRVCAKDAAFQTDRIVCSGAAEEKYEPRFQYSGFRYVVLRGLRQPPKRADLTACFVHTAFPVIGSFTCSDETFNTLMRMGQVSYLANFTDGVPTDCPHREKNGWTGDAGVASELAQYLVENTAGYEKWLRDILDAQLSDGNIPGIVPTSGWGYHWGNGPGWDMALPVTAWNLWVYRGDRRILDEVYAGIVKINRYLKTKQDADAIVNYGLADWISVTHAHMPTRAYTSSCYCYQMLRIAAEIAKLKGLSNDAKAHDKAAAKIFQGLRKRFYKGNGVWDNGLQTAQSVALNFGLVTGEERRQAEAQLVKAVAAADNHVDVGLYGMKHLFRALSRAGRSDLAWQMIVNPTKPSMVEWIQKGGTSLWEDWGSGGSRAHIMFGDFVAWAYQYLAGIRPRETDAFTCAVPCVTAPAMREMVIEPFFVKTLTHLSASTQTPYGKVAVAWQRTPQGVALTVEVPAGATAEVRLPGRAAEKIGAGVKRYTDIKD